jgi:hypothetical protein
MKRWGKVALLMLALLVVFFQICAHAAGEAGAQFLNIGVGSKACSMGDAFAALADDPSAIYWNPAGIAQMSCIEVMGMHSFWLLDISYQYVAAVLPSRYGAFGTAISYSSSGSIPKYENFEKKGEYTAYDAAGTVAYANTFKEMVSYGMGLKAIYQKIENETATGFAVDLGVLVTPELVKGLRGGLSVQNLGTGMRFIAEEDPLPLNLKGGLAYGTGPVSLSLDVNQPWYDDLRVNGGAEVSVGDILALRVGYNTANSYSAGAGFTWQRVSIDYAFVPYEDIDNTHQLSARLRF